MQVSDAAQKLPNLSGTQKVGVISNYFGEQLISNDYEIVKIFPYNIMDTIQKNEIETVFLEIHIYEIDHPWFNKDYDELLEIMESLDIKGVILSDHEEKLPDKFNKHYQLILNGENYIRNENKGIMPLTVSQKIFNPADCDKLYDILYFKVGKIEHSEEIEAFHKKFNPEFREVEVEDISREFLKAFSRIIKQSKVVYIYYSENLSEKLLKYLEIISTLQNTVMIIDSQYGTDFKYAISSHDSKSIVSYMSTFINHRMFRDKFLIPKTRQAFLENTLLHKRGINHLLNDKTGNHGLNNPYISVITTTKRRGNLKHLFSEINSQKHVSLQVILLTHGFELTDIEKDELYKQADFELIILTQNEDISFGNCLNECIKHIKYDYVIKMDDDDFYASNFLIDLWIGLKYSDAAIVGKNAFFFYLESKNLTAQRRMDFQFREVKEVKGNTLFCKTSTMREYGFEDLFRHVDSDYIIRIREDGGKIYSIHPYDMCVYRADDKEGHTFQASDSRFLRDADVLYYGKPNETIASD